MLSNNQKKCMIFFLLITFSYRIWFLWLNGLQMWCLHRRLETAGIWMVVHVLTVWIVKCFHKIFPEPTVCLRTFYDFPFCCESNLFPASHCANRCHEIKRHMASMRQQHLLRWTSCGWWRTYHPSACPSRCPGRERTWTAELSLRGSLRTGMRNKKFCFEVPPSGDNW